MRAGSPPRREHAREFAARDDVKAATRLGENLQQPQGAVGFHGVANLHAPPGKATLVSRQRGEHGRFGIHEQGRAVLRGEIGQPYGLHIEVCASAGDKG